MQASPSGNGQGRKLDLLRNAPVYEEFAPPAALCDFVACFWSFSVPCGVAAFEHAVVPDGTVSVVLIRKGNGPLREVRIVGPRTTALHVPVEPGDAFWGARLLPGASGPLLGITAAALRNRVEPLEPLLPEIAREMSRELAATDTAADAFSALAAALTVLAARAPAIDPAVCFTATHLLRSQGSAKVSTLAKDAGLSERQLRRRFCEATGLSPKEFARLIRVRCACIDIANSSPVPLAAVAQNAGYADQAHLSREFASVFGAPAGNVSTLFRSFVHGGFRAE